MQVVTVLLNNALDACCDSHTPKVEVAIKNTEAALIISVSDNGPGLESGTKTSLFKPKVSTKTTGLGVGLYIARHLVVSQFKGTLKLARSKTGARFVIRIPRIYEK